MPSNAKAIRIQLLCSALTYSVLASLGLKSNQLSKAITTTGFPSLYACMSGRSALGMINPNSSRNSRLSICVSRYPCLCRSWLLSSGFRPTRNQLSARDGLIRYQDLPRYKSTINNTIYYHLVNVIEQFNIICHATKFFPNAFHGSFSPDSGNWSRIHWT